MGGLGIEVLRLVRIAIGPLQLGNLAKGKVRELTAGEITAIVRAGTPVPPQSQHAKPRA